MGMRLEVVSDKASLCHQDNISNNNATFTLHFLFPYLSSEATSKIKFFFIKSVLKASF